MFPDRNKNRSKRMCNWYEIAEQKYRERIAAAHKIEDIMDFIDEHIPQVQFLINNKHARMTGWPEYGDLDIQIWKIPYDQVVQHIAGPLHRNYEVDWNLEVVYDGLKLSTKIKPRGFGEAVDVTIHVTKGPTLGCEIMESSTVEWTELRHRSYKMKCVGEDD